MKSPQTSLKTKLQATAQNLTRQFQQSFKVSRQAASCRLPQSLPPPLTVLEGLRQWLRPHPHLQSHHRGCVDRKSPPIIGLVAVVSLTGTLGTRLYNVPQLAVGKIAPQTIRAPQDAAVEDVKATVEKRREARKLANKIWAVDSQATQATYESLERSLQSGHQLRHLAGPFPFVDTSILSLSNQQALRQLPEAEWLSLLKDLELNVNGVQADDSLLAAELQLYRLGASRAKFQSLIETLQRARDRYQQALQRMEVDSETTRLILKLSEEEWQQTQVAVRQAATRILSQGIVPGLPPQILQQAIDIQLDTTLPVNAKPLAQQLLQEVLKPNLVEDSAQTQLFADQAAQAVEPVILKARQGEIIIQQGEIIDQASFVLLDHFQLSQRGMSWWGFLGVAVAVTGGWTLLGWIEHRYYRNFRRRDRIVLLLLALSTPLLLHLGVSQPNLPAVGLLLGSFYGAPLGTIGVGLLGIGVSLGFEMNAPDGLAAVVGGLICAVSAGRLRSREELALLGLGIGVAQVGVHFLTYLLLNGWMGLVWYQLLQAAALSGLSGLAWTIVALGLSPYLEQLFDLITPTRLAELANPNCPLLKRLAAEAPGTFQHTLFVATLAEAAARQLGCNVELVRAGTLYHDIGKMHDPLGFIENQMGGPNKHDQINDPWESAVIIKKHVTEGLAIAKRCRLPKAIQAFIPEHQGTMLIAYFYHQAQQQALQEPTIEVREEDFRYEGPIPRSRETGIVMLADSCEAALRSLKDATPEQALTTINKILRARWQDNQLVSSGLKREDLTTIAEVFVKVWQQFNHQRIAYPKLTAGK